MKSHRKGFVRNTSMVKGILFGTGVCLLVTTVGAMVTAWLIANETVSLDIMGAGCAIILLLASMVGSFTASRIFQDKRLLVCAIQMAVYGFLLIASHVIFFEGQYDGMLLNLSMIIIGGSVPVISNPRRKSEIKRMRKNRAFR